MRGIVSLAPLLWALYQSPADADQVDIVRYCQTVVNDVYLKPFDLSDDISLVLQAVEFGPEESPDLAKVEVRHHDPCSPEEPQVLLRITVSMKRHPYVGFSAEGPAIEELRNVDEHERTKRMDVSIQAIIAVTGWQKEGSVIPFPRDQSRDVISFLGGEPRRSILAFIDHASGVPVYVGMPF